MAREIPGAQYPGELPTNASFEEQLDDFGHGDGDGNIVYRQTYPSDYWFNKMKAELQAIATELGVQPKGDYDSVVDRLGSFSRITSFTDGDTVPCISSGNIFKTTNTGATTITSFNAPFEGQCITVIFGDSDTIIDFTDTNLYGNGGVDWYPYTNDHMRCVYDGSKWFCNVSVNSASGVV